MSFKSKKILKELYLWITNWLYLYGIEQKNPIIIYQMGKVGSSTVKATIETLGLECPVLHVHTLNETHKHHALTRVRQSISPYLPKHLIVSSLLIHKFKKGIFPCRFITLTRNPIERAVSFVFEDWKKQSPNAIKQEGEFDSQIIKETITKLLSGDTGTALPEQWFDRELRDTFGLDVFREAFNYQKGYQIIEKECLSLLIMRMEDLNWALPNALSKFLNIESKKIEIIKANESAKKWYSDVYSEVKSSVKLSKETAERVLNSHYFRHFYSSNHKKMVDKWCN